MFQSINPYSNTLFFKIPFEQKETLLAKQQTALQAFNVWKHTSFEDRVVLFQKLASKMRNQKKQLAEQATKEMGKPIQQSLAEIEKCCSTIDWYCKHGASFIQEKLISDLESANGVIRFEAMGLVLGIMPWNFPFWQVFRYVIPTLLAGNVTLLKHAPNVPACANLIEKLFIDADFPRGILQTIYASTDDTAALIQSEGTHAVTFTGSESAGRSIASVAGKALKKCVLELGGSDPFIVLKDADLTTTIVNAITGRLQNNGQSCIAAKRFIIEEPIYDRFMMQLAEAVGHMHIGDPMLEETEIGPLARPDLKKLLQTQVSESVNAGASIYYRHPFDDANTNFFAPVILENIPYGCPAQKDELFGPVFSCFKAIDTDHALQIANETTFGLGASIWSSDVHAAEALAFKIEAGSVFINGIVKSDARLPFGGIKHSGYGRELSEYGMLEFVNIKSYWKNV